MNKRNGPPCLSIKNIYSLHKNIWFQSCSEGGPIHVVHTLLSLPTTRVKLNVPLPNPTSMCSNLSPTLSSRINNSIESINFQQGPVWQRRKRNEKLSHCGRDDVIAMTSQVMTMLGCANLETFKLDQLGFEAGRNIINCKKLCKLYLECPGT